MGSLTGRKAVLDTASEVTANAKILPSIHAHFLQYLCRLHVRPLICVRIVSASERDEPLIGPPSLFSDCRNSGAGLGFDDWTLRWRLSANVA
jgi:hypothetical protein